MSASEGEDDSLPRTNNGQEELPRRMGRIGPLRGANLYDESPSTADGDDARPVKLINSSSDLMSVVSEPTMDGFGPPPVAATEGETLRYSHTDLNPSSEGSSQTNENRVLRQGAVDKMVMEALRQAQEARQTSGHSGHHVETQAGPMRTIGQITNPQGSHSASATGSARMAPPPFVSGGSGGIGQQPTAQTSQYSRVSSLSRASGSKSPHGRKQQLSFRMEKKNRKHTQASFAGAPTGSLARSGSGEGNGGGGKSLHSFYSQSETGTAPSIGDAFPC